MFPFSTPLPLHTLLLLFTKCSLFRLPSPSILHFCVRTTCRLVVHFVPTIKFNLSLDIMSVKALSTKPTFNPSTLLASMRGCGWGNPKRWMKCLPGRSKLKMNDKRTTDGYWSDGRFLSFAKSGQGARGRELCLCLDWISSSLFLRSMSPECRVYNLPSKRLNRRDVRLRCILCHLP